MAKLYEVTLTQTFKGVEQKVVRTEADSAEDAANMVVELPGGYKHDPAQDTDHELVHTHVKVVEPRLTHSFCVDEEEAFIAERWLTDAHIECNWVSENTGEFLSTEVQLQAARFLRSRGIHPRVYDIDDEGEMIDVEADVKPVTILGLDFYPYEGNILKCQRGDHVYLWNPDERMLREIWDGHQQDWLEGVVQGTGINH